MKEVIETVTNLRLRRAPVYAAVIRTVARGAIIANNRSLLLENGGYIDFSTDWSRHLLYRFEKLGRKMTSLMVTTELQAWHEISDLIINFDQTPLPYVCTGKRTYHTQDASNVPLVGKGKKSKLQVPSQ